MFSERKSETFPLAYWSITHAYMILGKANWLGVYDLDYDYLCCVVFKNLVEERIVCDTKRSPPFKKIRFILFAQIKSSIQFCYFWNQAEELKLL